MPPYYIKKFKIKKLVLIMKTISKGFYWEKKIYSTLEFTFVFQPCFSFPGMISQINLKILLYE